MAAKLEIPATRAEEVVREFKARQRWTSLVTTFRRTCELAGWSTEHMAKIFGQVDALSVSRQKPKKED